jgi:serine/threonine protein kinase
VLFKIAQDTYKPEIPDNLSDDGKLFLQLCLQRDQRRRPTSAQLLGHPFTRNQGLASSSRMGCDPSHQIKSLGNAWMHYCSMHGASTGSSLSEPCPVVWKRKNSSIRKHGYHAPTHLIYYGIWFRRLAYVDKSLPNWHIYSFNSHPYSSDAWTVLSLSFHRKKIIICLLWFVLIDLDRWMEIWWLLVVVWTDATWNIAYPW